MKFTLQEKLKFARIHFDDGLPFSEISKKYHIEITGLKYACRLYERWGSKAFKEDNQRRKYARETKLRAIHDMEMNNKTYRDIGIELMMTNANIVRDWYQKYKSEGEVAIQDTFAREAYKHHDDKVLEKEYKKLLQDLEYTKAENEYLKKSYALILKRSKPQRKKSK
jgi:transposase-like protein